MEEYVALRETLRQFVAQERAVPLEKVQMDTTLFGALGLDGDDAAEFFETFSRQFEVDLSRFDRSTHFGPEAGWPWETIAARIRYFL